jgi:hypothetical protein
MLPLRRFMFAVSAACLVAPSLVYAAPVTYEFDKGAFLTSPDFGPDPAPITGSFMVDLATQSESNVTISFTTPNGTFKFGPTSDILPDTIFSSGIYACQGAPVGPNCLGSTVLHVGFTVPLDGSGPAPLTGFLIDSMEMIQASGSAGGTASPVPVSSVPEPASFALLLAALGIFFSGVGANSYSARVKRNRSLLGINGGGFR